MSSTTTAAQLSLYPGIPPATQHTVVTMAARGYALSKIADATTLPIVTIQQIGRHYGAPNLGTLAHSAEALSRHLDTDDAGADDPRPPAPVGVHPALHEIRQSAELLGAHRLVRHVDQVTAQIDQLHIELDAARDAHLAKIVAKSKADKARRAKVAALAKAKAAAAELAAQLKAETANAHRIEAELNRLTPDERGRLRVWAAEQQLDCPAIGPIPKAIRTAWTEAGRP